MIDLIQTALESMASDLCVALPGRVESYDASAQTADVKPMIRRLVPTPDEDHISEEMPVIYSVPVCHPGGNGWGLHIPLAAGDTVLLVFSQWDPSEWRRTGDIADPADHRSHNASHAVAIPGYRSKQAPISGASSSDVTFMKDGFGITIKSDKVEIGGSSDAAALASKVDDQLNDLKTALNGWTPVSQDGGAALKAALVSWVADLAATASTKLKLGG